MKKAHLPFGSELRAELPSARPGISLRADAIHLLALPLPG